MPTINFVISYGKNEGLIISPSELTEQYFHGIPMCTVDGRTLSQETIREKIVIAQDVVEKLLQIKLNKQVISEQTDFNRGDWNAFGFNAMSSLIKAPLSLTGFIGTVKQIEYPLEWLSVNKPSEESWCNRNVHIVPAGSTSASTTNSVIFSGITPHLGFLGLQSIPNYWEFKYVTGFDKVPASVRDLVGKLAALQILGILGDIILGIGVTSQSLTLDGLSQSVATSRSGQTNLFGARMKQYSDETLATSKQLRDYYVGITFFAM